MHDILKTKFVGLDSLNKYFIKFTLLHDLVSFLTIRTIASFVVNPVVSMLVTLEKS